MRRVSIIYFLVIFGFNFVYQNAFAVITSDLNGYSQPSPDLINETKLASTVSNVSNNINDKTLQIHEDPEIHFGGDVGYIYPNEGYPEYFKKAFEKSQRGTLISVGPGFRALIGASLGKFDRIIMTDIHPKVNTFNKGHLELLKAIGRLPISPKFQRYQYLAVLHCKWLNTEELTILSQLEEGFSPAKPLNSQFLSKLDSFVPANPGCNTESYPIEIQPALSQLKSIKIEDRFWAPPYFNKPSKVEENFLGGYYYSHESKKDYDRDRPSYYWENDSDWIKIQELAQNGDRIRVISGNIYGDHAFSSLGVELTKRGEQVSVVDVSNILDYLQGGRFEEDTEEDNLQYQKFLLNLKQLPHNDETLVLRTTRGALAGALTDPGTYSWTYFWSKLKGLISKDYPNRKKDWYSLEDSP